MNRKEVEDIARDVSNAVYAAVSERIEKHEKRGWNAHHRAQHLCEMARLEVVSWLSQQYSSDPGFNE